MLWFGSSNEALENNRPEWVGRDLVIEDLGSVEKVATLFPQDI